MLTSYDIVADAGNATGVMKTFPVVSDGTVDVSFAHKINNPLISGIEIVRTDGPDAAEPGHGAERRLLGHGRAGLPDAPRHRDRLALWPAAPR